MKEIVPVELLNRLVSCASDDDLKHGIEVFILKILNEWAHEEENTRKRKWLERHKYEEYQPVKGIFISLPTELYKRIERHGNEYDVIDGKNGELEYDITKTIERMCDAWDFEEDSDDDWDDL